MKSESSKDTHDLNITNQTDIYRKDPQQWQNTQQSQEHMKHHQDKRYYRAENKLLNIFQSRNHILYFLQQQGN